MDKIEEPVIYQFEDSADIFEREPYGILVKPKEIGNIIIILYNDCVVCVQCYPP